jgi:hypothetical protein
MLTMTECLPDPTQRKPWDQPIRNDPISGLWVFAVVAVLAVTAARLVDRPPAPGACVPGLGLPSVIDRVASWACVGTSTPLYVVTLHVPVLIACSWFFLECFRWGSRCLRFRWARKVLTVGRIWVVLGAAGLDVIMNILVLATGSTGSLYGLPVLLWWLRLLLLGVTAIVVAVVLLNGLVRFAMPWTIPPAMPAELPTCRTSNEPPQPVRTRAKDDHWLAGPDGPYPGVAYGIGLSGGGVRSAAFCSGVLQALDGSTWSPSAADYLATVSGGGYVGVSSQIIRHALGQKPGIDPYALATPETRGFERRHRYLADDALERAQILLALVTGWILNVALIMGPLALLGAVLALVPPTFQGRSADLVLFVTAVVLLVIAALLSLAGAAEGQPTDGLTEDGGLHGSRWLIGFGVIVGGPLLVLTVPFDQRWVVAAGALAVAGVIACTIANVRSNPFLLNLSRLLFSASWVTVGLIVIGFVASGRLGNPTALSEPDSRGWWWGLLIGAVLLAVAYSVLDQTSWSPHPFYKARIAATFAMRRIQEGDEREDFQVLPYDEYTYLDTWAKRMDGGPELLVCATANAEDVALPPVGTRAVPFVFTHDHVGSPELGWWRTADFRRCLGRKLARDGTLQAATAISGAAVASGLGLRGRIPSVGTAMALLNARLGVWLPNPNARGTALSWPEDGRLRAAWVRGRRPLWLWREVSGLLPSRRRFIYVSDGGHLDNLGLLELLRRRCEKILIVDASADKVRTTRTLDGVCELATQHFGIAFQSQNYADLIEKPEADPSVFGGVRPRGMTKDCIEHVKVIYPPSGAETAGREGLLIVAKARFATTLGPDPDAGAVVKAIKDSGLPFWWPWSLKSLPATITVNQSLTTEQFESYVALGRAVGRLARSRLEGKTAPTIRGTGGPFRERPTSAVRETATAPT